MNALPLTLQRPAATLRFLAFWSIAAICGVGLATKPILAERPSEPATDEPAAKEAEQEAPIRVTLMITKGQFDPGDPKGFLVCTAKNTSDKAIEIPTGLKSALVHVYGQATTSNAAQATPRGWAMHLYHRQGRNEQPQDKADETIQLPPGAQATIFKLPLEDLLADRRDKPQTWSWDWPARPSPPDSPIHQIRNDGYQQGAEFWVDVTLGKLRVTSNRAKLSVKK